MPAVHLSESALLLGGRELQELPQELPTPSSREPPCTPHHSCPKVLMKPGLSEAGSSSGPVC